MCRYKHCSEADVFQWGVEIGEENITANEWLTEAVDNAGRKQNNTPRLPNTYKVGALVSIDLILLE
ncbi:MAG: hypothetical protein KAJ52_05820 [Sedimentisphaerales bacterium]|nr:hypothetical protein [Sedimentisphaerales bacterium]